MFVDVPESVVSFCEVNRLLGKPVVVLGGEDSGFTEEMGRFGHFIWTRVESTNNTVKLLDSIIRLTFPSYMFVCDEFVDESLATHLETYNKYPLLFFSDTENIPKILEKWILV